ncbi:MAG: hypothetical protein CFE34_08180 [Rhodobacteraceae bacterium PARR1]|nr:MAG: hypothetical protein CFE34_08180 [Rhodobacteraceae bacterium PARR1]
MTLSAAVIILAVFAVGLALIVFGWRARRAAAASAVVALAPLPVVTEDAVEAAADPVDAISQRVAALLHDHERRLTDAFSHVREDLSGLKSDVEWLAGERMIEQAIALAQTGSDAEEIGQELGLSRDQAATIALFRKH